MPNEYFDVNTPKAISASTGVGISYDITARRAAAPSVKPANNPLDCPPLHVLS